MSAAMTVTVTLILLGVFIVLTVGCGWMGARAPDIHRGPRLIPYRFLMIFSAALALIMMVHLVNLGGLQTGPNRPF